MQWHILLLLFALACMGTSELVFDMPYSPIVTNYTIAGMTEGTVSFADKVYGAACNWQVSTSRSATRFGLGGIQLLDFRFTASQGSMRAAHGSTAVSIDRVGGARSESIMAWDTRAGSMAANSILLETDVTVDPGEVFTVVMGHQGLIALAPMISEGQ